MNRTIDQTNLPQALFVYGPAGSGKGTQAMKLLNVLTDYKHIEFGGELRLFVANNVENNSEPELQKIALRMKEKMDTGLPVELDDLKFVVEKAIIDTLNSGKKILLDGAGRSVAEAKWQAKFFKENNISSAIVHLHLGLEDVIKRTTGRWYVPGSSQPYISKESASKDCPTGVDPIQRADDIDIDSIKNRYYKQYREYVAEILGIYQTEGGATIFFVDAEKTIDEVFDFILNSLDKNYNS